MGQSYEVGEPAMSPNLQNNRSREKQMSIAIRWRLAARYRIYMASLILFVFMCAGCRPVSSEITGVVCTRSDVTRSYLLSTDLPDPEHVALRGATVYLSSNDVGKDAIDGTVCLSDKDGRYRIPTAALSGESYFLVVKKEGFETLIRRVRMGPLSRYNRNTAVLKALKDSAHRGFGASGHRLFSCRVAPRLVSVS
jgi:hypothetical protein